MGLDTVSMKMKLIFEREWRFPGTVLLQKKTLFVAIFLKKIIVIRKKDKLAATRFFSKWAERHIKMIHCKQSKSMLVREGERERQREGLYVANCAKNTHYPCLQV